MKTVLFKFLRALCVLFSIFFGIISILEKDPAYSFVCMMFFACVLTLTEIIDSLKGQIIELEYEEKKYQTILNILSALYLILIYANCFIFADSLFEAGFVLVAIISFALIMCLAGISFLAFLVIEEFIKKNSGHTKNPLSI